MKGKYLLLKKEKTLAGKGLKVFLSILLLVLMVLPLWGFNTFSKGDGVDRPAAGGGVVGGSPGARVRSKYP